VKSGSPSCPIAKSSLVRREDERIVGTFDLDFGEIVSLAGAASSGVVLLRLRLARQHHLRERLQAAIAGAAEALASWCDRGSRGYPYPHQANAARELSGRRRNRSAATVAQGNKCLAEIPEDAAAMAEPVERRLTRPCD
jgi:hypothetical protein